MELTERTYRTLVVSSAQKLVDSLLPVLPGCRCEPATTARDAGTARRRMLENSYDIIIINTPLTDEFGTRLALDIAGDSSAGVLLLVRSEHFADIEAKVSSSGVFVLSRPTTSAMLTQCLTLLCATRERLRRMEQKNTTMEEKMEEIRLVNRAKWLLIDRLGMTEPDAHSYLQKLAMDLRVSRRTAAEGVIRKYGNNSDSQN